jgi:hypothetical protein
MGRWSLGTSLLPFKNTPAAAPPAAKAAAVSLGEAEKDAEIGEVLSRTHSIDSMAGRIYPRAVDPQLLVRMRRPRPHRAERLALNLGGHGRRSWHAPLTRPFTCLFAIFLGARGPRAPAVCGDSALFSQLNLVRSAPRVSLCLASLWAVEQGFNLFALRLRQRQGNRDDQLIREANQQNKKIQQAYADGVVLPPEAPLVKEADAIFESINDELLVYFSDTLEAARGEAPLLHLFRDIPAELQASLVEKVGKEKVDEALLLLCMRLASRPKADLGDLKAAWQRSDFFREWLSARNNDLRAIFSQGLIERITDEENRGTVTPQRGSHAQP